MLRLPLKRKRAKIRVKLTPLWPKSRFMVVCQIYGVAWRALHKTITTHLSDAFHRSRLSVGELSTKISPSFCLLHTFYSDVFSLLCMALISVKVTLIQHLLASALLGAPAILGSQNVHCKSYRTTLAVICMRQVLLLLLLLQKCVSIPHWASKPHQTSMILQLLCNILVSTIPF